MNEANTEDDLGRASRACTLCGEPNAATAVRCARCNFGFGLQRPPARPMEASWLEKKFVSWGWIRGGPPRCRFCDGEVRIEAQSCPHCARRLGSTLLTPSLQMDTWQHDFSEQAFEGVDTMPRRGGLKLLLLGVTIVAVAALAAWTFALWLL